MDIAVMFLRSICVGLASSHGCAPFCKKDYLRNSKGVRIAL